VFKDQKLQKAWI